MTKKSGSFQMRGGRKVPPTGTYSHSLCLPPTAATAPVSVAGFSWRLRRCVTRLPIHPAGRLTGTGICGFIQSANAWRNPPRSRPPTALALGLLCWRIAEQLARTEASQSAGTPGTEACARMTRRIAEQPNIARRLSKVTAQLEAHLLVSRCGGAGRCQGYSPCSARRCRISGLFGFERGAASRGRGIVLTPVRLVESAHR